MIKKNLKAKCIRYFIKMALYFLILLMGGCASAGQSDLLPQGTKVDNLDLSNSSVHEAEEKVKEWSQDKLAETRVLMYNETEVPVSLKEMGINLDDQKTMDGIGLDSGKAKTSTLKVDRPKVKQFLQKKLEIFNQPAKNASYKVENDKVVITPDQKGRTVDLDKMIDDMQKSSLGQVPSRIVLPMVEVPASVTTESLQSLAFDSIIGECTTQFSSQEKNRSANLAAAAKALDRKVIRPGEIFSFNNTVGPRQPETGYKDAYVIINGKFVPGVGGGVCQVSSTLYNAVLLSDLKVVERMPHALAVTYIAAGQDATVNYPNIDFKFQNNTAGLLYLRTEAKNGDLTIQIWGRKTDNTVRIERQIEKTMNYKTKRIWDPNLSPGHFVQEQKGAKGLVVSTWKVVRDGSGKETKLLVSKDTYAPTNRILRVGTKG